MVNILISNNCNVNFVASQPLKIDECLSQDNILYGQIFLLLTNVNYEGARLSVSMG